MALVSHIQFHAGTNMECKERISIYKNFNVYICYFDILRYFAWFLEWYINLNEVEYGTTVVIDDFSNHIEGFHIFWNFVFSNLSNSVNVWICTCSMYNPWSKYLSNIVILQTQALLGRHNLPPLSLTNEKLFVILHKVQGCHQHYAFL